MAPSPGNKKKSGDAEGDKRSVARISGRRKEGGRKREKKMAQLKRVPFR